MLKNIVIGLGCALVISGCATTKTETAAKAVDSDKLASNDQVICKTVKKVGSNFPRRICYTRDEIDRNREALRRLQNNTGHTSNADSQR